MISFKAGVSIKGITPQIVLAMKVIDDIIYSYAKDTGQVVFNNYSRIDFVVTSVNDSSHMEGSKHYSGNALDIRTHDWYFERTLRILDLILKVLKPLGYDVIFESKGTPNEHIHIEYDPKD